MIEEWRDGVVAEAEQWLGTPYQHKGRRLRVGVDCGGLLYQVYNPFFGPFRPFPADYAADWALHRENELYLGFIRDYVEEVPAPVKGGFTLFHFGRNFSHAAIFTGADYIHAYGRNQFGSVVRNKPGFFGRRLRKHFDVSKEWLSSRL